MPQTHGLVFTPVHRQVDAAKLEQFGTGTLISFESFEVLLSAAHVIAEARRLPVLLPGSPKFFCLSAPAIMSDLGCREAGVPDPFDIGFKFLDKTQKQSLEAAGLRFLSHREIATADQLSIATQCVFSGFAASQSDVRVGAGISRSKPLYAKCPMSFRSIDGFEYLVGEYDRKSLVLDGTSTRVTGPEMWGCSGGPVWVTSPAGHAKLAGIGIYYDPSRCELRATPIGAIVDQILKHAPNPG